MAYRVEISRLAETEALEAFVWKGEQLGMQAATRWYNGLMQAIYSLQEFPHRCPLAPESDVFEEEIRQLLYGKRSDTYRILFSIRNDTTASIPHIRHGAQGRLGNV